MQLDNRSRLVAFLTDLAKSDSRMLEKGKPELDFTVLKYRIGKDLANQLLSVLYEIRREIVPKHADNNSLVNAFWDELVCEVVTNRDSYINDQQTVISLIDKFGQIWKPPLHNFIVAYAICYLDLGSDIIILNGVRFLPLDDAGISEADIPRSTAERWSKRDGCLAFAITEVTAASSDLAFPAGKDQVDDAIALMRASALRGLSPTGHTDDLVQWHLSGDYFVRPMSSNGSSVLVEGSHRQFGPFMVDLSDYIRHGIKELQLEALADTPNGVREPLHRAIYWIAHSATHESHDHKLLDLCTALEILLLPDGSRISNKGAVLALRYSLLGGTFNPTSVKWMYDRRNEIVHGDRLWIVEPRDIWYLRLLCSEIIRLIVQAPASRHEVATLKNIIESVETRNTITTFLMRVEDGWYDNNPLLCSLVEEAKRRLKAFDREIHELLQELEAKVNSSVSSQD